MNSGKSAPKLLPSWSHRTLTTDEEHLWSLVARSVRPLRVAKKAAADGRNKAAVRQTTRTVTNMTAVDPHAAIPPRRSAGVPALSPFLRAEKQKLARGNATIDARIDLHGMTQAQAHGALQKLLHRSQASGAKFVLVITGKGAPNASRADRGVLRRQVPMWLGLPEFRRYVLGFDVADANHGGEGALYVRLRKAKAY